jgi:hypothetical protein
MVTFAGAVGICLRSVVWELAVLFALGRTCLKSLRLLLFATSGIGVSTIP